MGGSWGSAEAPGAQLLPRLLRPWRDPSFPRASAPLRPTLQTDPLESPQRATRRKGGDSRPLWRKTQVLPFYPPIALETCLTPKGQGDTVSHHSQTPAQLSATSSLLPIPSQPWALCTPGFWVQPFELPSTKFTLKNKIA